MIRRGLFVFLAWTVAMSSTGQPPAVIRRGTTRDEVRKTLGPPERISRQILYRRHIEQWHYTHPPRTIDFNCVRGEEPYAN